MPRPARIAVWLLLLMWPLAPYAGERSPPLRPDAGGDVVDVWVRLTQPGLARLPAGATEAEREIARARLLAQQDQVMAALRELGGQELGRVQTVHSALAVRLPRAQLDAARRLDGVQSVAPVRDRSREPPGGPRE